ncbi:hypothetical protein EDD18DRAFT_1400423 [Armillaria luteobubalina]|uniref:Uncharacterized protein n=1 Tax=Armillaria luteobubalina TaxID=153913 RepID=A0AA39Q1F5_9AGAR|nr:hypothetical protein EDD18DRAFT_1400423 [Armillaria luteobubalina]
MPTTVPTKVPCTMTNASWHSASALRFRPRTIAKHQHQHHGGGRCHRIVGKLVNWIYQAVEPGRQPTVLCSYLSWAFWKDRRNDGDSAIRVKGSVFKNFSSVLAVSSVLASPSMFRDDAVYEMLTIYPTLELELTYWPTPIFVGSRTSVLCTYPLHAAFAVMCERVTAALLSSSTYGIYSGTTGSTVRFYDKVGHIFAKLKFLEGFGRHEHGLKHFLSNYRLFFELQMPNREIRPHTFNSQGNGNGTETLLSVPPALESSAQAAEDHHTDFGSADLGRIKAEGRIQN